MNTSLFPELDAILVAGEVPATQEKKATPEKPRKAPQKPAEAPKVSSPPQAVKAPQKPAKGALSRSMVLSWAKELELPVESEDTALGEALVVDGRIALIINPRGESSAQLREIQKEWREGRGIAVYYVYSWEVHSAKLLSHFKSKLGMDSRKYAAKRLRLEEIDNSVGNDFMREYHIQGVAGGASKVSIALMEKNTGEILAVQQFAKSRWGNKKGEGVISNSEVWEGLRLCFKPDVQIYGGASRLQKYFEQRYHPAKIISYINASHSSGVYKASQGFTDVTDWNQFSYMWVLDGEPKIVPIIDRDGNRRVNDPKASEKKRFINPSSMAGAFGKGVGETLYGGRLGSRKQLREHSENGDLISNDPILAEVGYRMNWTAGQYKWIKEFPEHQVDAEE